MVFEYNSLDAKKGITVLFDITDTMKSLLCNMLGKANVEDQYLYIVGADGNEFREYYRKVCEECEDINEVFVNCGKYNTAGVCPKTMFVFDNMRSCNNFRVYFERISLPEEKERSAIAYSSTDRITMILSIPHSLCVDDEIDWYE